jgi:hypothetical protein
MSDSPVQQAIAEWKDGAISGSQLVRRLVSYDAWVCPISADAAAEMLASNAASRLSYSRDARGVSRLYLFSDADSVSRFRRSLGENEGEWHLLETTGAWFFQLPLDQIDFIEIDPGSPWTIGYRKEQFATLAAMAHAVDVERALAGPRAGTAAPAGTQLVHDYQHYLLAVVNRGDGYSLALAPDSRARSLAAVFTAQDNFDAFCAEQVPTNQEAQIMPFELPGEKLFAQLQQMQLDGLVFNCSGPAKPVAFAAAFAGVILQAGRRA